MVRALMAPICSNLWPFWGLAHGPSGAVSEARSSPQAVRPKKSIGAKRINHGEMIFGLMCVPKSHWANSANIQWATPMVDDSLRGVSQ